MTRLVSVSLLVALAACSTVADRASPSADTALVARLSASDGAALALWRWPRKDAPKVLVVPELGFDHRLVGALCGRLQAEGFDVAAIDGRHVAASAGSAHGWNGWLLDVARALREHGPDTRVVAIGVAGAAALEVASVADGAARRSLLGIVAVNVPQRLEVSNVALATALARDFFDPASWVRAGDGNVLLASGRSTSDEVSEALTSLARPVPPVLARNAAAMLMSREPVPAPLVPVRVLASFRDNLVPPELQIVEGGPQAARRMGRIELFAADYGHLDWLVDPRALADVAPVIADELRALGKEASR